MTTITEIRTRFERAAANYAKHAIMPATIEARLLERLDFFKIKPTCVVDLGVGLGQSTQALKRRYPKARVLGIDISYSMLKRAQNKSPWWSKPGFIQADVLALPLASKSVDLIFANQLLPYLADTQAFFSEAWRILKPGGCLLFSSLGPDTYKEFGPQTFVDMHDLGDALVATGFSDPVIDREDLVLRYASALALIEGLEGQGDFPHLSQTPELWQAYPKDAEKWPLSYEVIYGHAWRVERKKQAGIQTIAWQTLKEQLNKG